MHKRLRFSLCITAFLPLPPPHKPHLIAVPTHRILHPATASNESTTVVVVFALHYVAMEGAGSHFFFRILNRYFFGTPFISNGSFGGMGICHIVPQNLQAKTQSLFVKAATIIVPSSSL